MVITKYVQHQSVRFHVNDVTNIVYQHLPMYNLIKKHGLSSTFNIIYGEFITLKKIYTIHYTSLRIYKYSNISTRQVQLKDY